MKNRMQNKELTREQASCAVIVMFAAVTIVLVVLNVAFVWMRAGG